MILQKIFSTLKQTPDFITALVILAFYALLGYIVYYILVYAYPRFSIPGHSSELEGFMVVYLKELIELKNDLLDNETLTKTLAPDVVNKLKEFIETTKNLQKINLKRKADCRSEAQRDLYIICIYYRALIEDGRDIKELNTLKSFFRKAIVDEFFEGADIKTDSLNTHKDAAKAFRALKDALATYITNKSEIIKEPCENNQFNDHSYEELNIIIKLMKLDLLINRYFDGRIENQSVLFKDNIIRNYDMRKSGGIANFIIYKIYMQDYIDYVFHRQTGTIPKTWNPFKKELLDTVRRYEEIVASQKVQQFIQRLPFKIAGVEESFADLPPIDVNEHFFQLLAAIAKTFVAMFKVVVAIAKAIAEPIKFLKLLIGFAIGVFFFCGYMVVMALGFIIFPCVATIVLGLSKIMITVFWLAIFISIAIIYFILWILDYPTGGAILKLLRCENLPNDWQTRPGFAYGNYWKRSFFCTCPCMKGYRPSTVGMFCDKIDKLEPVFCPQQIIFAAFNNDEGLLKGKTLYSYVPKTDYYLQMTKEEKQELWARVYKGRNDYLDQCEESLGDFNHLGQTTCQYFYKWQPRDEKGKKLRAKVLEICRTSYCREKECFKFCKKPDEEEKKLVEQQPNEKYDLITNNLIMVVLLIVLVAGLAAFYHIFRKPVDKVLRELTDIVIDNGLDAFMEALRKPRSKSEPSKAPNEGFAPGKFMRKAKELLKNKGVLKPLLDTTSRVQQLKPEMPVFTALPQQLKKQLADQTGMIQSQLENKKEQIADIPDMIPSSNQPEKIELEPAAANQSSISPSPHQTEQQQELEPTADPEESGMDNADVSKETRSSSLTSESSMISSSSPVENASSSRMSESGYQTTDDQEIISENQINLDLTSRSSLLTQTSEDLNPKPQTPKPSVVWPSILTPEPVDNQPEPEIFTSSIEARTLAEEARTLAEKARTLAKEAEDIEQKVQENESLIRNKIAELEAQKKDSKTNNEVLLSNMKYGLRDRLKVLLPTAKKNAEKAKKAADKAHNLAKSALEKAEKANNLITNEIGNKNQKEVEEVKVIIEEANKMVASVNTSVASIQTSVKKAMDCFESNDVGCDYYFKQKPKSTTFDHIPSRYQTYNKPLHQNPKHSNPKKSQTLSKKQKPKNTR